jgi:ferrochelatase
MSSAVVLVAHGTVDDLDDLPDFLKNIRRGHAASPELLAEVRRRYEAIGGKSPLNEINRRIASRLEARLGVPVRFANRLYKPYPRDVLPELVSRGVTHLFVLPLAQYSASIYGDAVREAALHAGMNLEITVAPNWGNTPELVASFARAICRILSPLSDAELLNTTLLFTAHSLPLNIVLAGDPYETEFRASTESVAEALRALMPGREVDHVVAFQSQGMSTGPGGRPMAWLGPDLRTQLGDLKARGKSNVVVAPIGFLADHVEILYDLDIEAQGWASELGLSLRRVESLNASDDFIDALVAVTQCRMEDAADHKEGRREGE